MSLKPWREITRPNEDVLEGMFNQSGFLADITQFATGTESVEYQDAEKFFSRNLRFFFPFFLGFYELLF